MGNQIEDAGPGLISITLWGKSNTYSPRSELAQLPLAEYADDAVLPEHRPGDRLIMHESMLRQFLSFANKYCCKLTGSS